MKYISLIGLLSALITHQTIGMEQEGLMHSAGRYAAANPTQCTIIAGLCGAATGTIFNSPSEGFVAGALAWNSLEIALYNSENVIRVAIETAIQEYTRQNHDNHGPLFRRLDELNLLEQGIREWFHERTIKASLRTGIILGGYACKKLCID